LPEGGRLLRELELIFSDWTDDMSSLRVFAAPPRYVQGPGALDKLGEIAAPFGPDILVITDPVVHSMLGERITANMVEAGLRPVVGMLTGEITYAAVDDLVRELGEAGAGAGIVVGVGGGKALDAAKSVALRLQLPVITVPTIASNDSPASGAMAMYDDTHTLVSVDRLPRHPEAVVVDTVLIARAPTAFLRSGIGDAISKKFEVEGCLAGTGLSLMGTRPLVSAAAIADACYGTIRAHAPGAIIACDNNQVTDDLEAVVEAVVLMSALGFENGGLSLAHAMTRGLMAARGASSAMHGLHVAWGLLVQFVILGRSPAELAELMGFYRKIGLAVSLAELGLPDPTPEELEDIVARSLAAPHIVNLPVAVDAASLTAAVAVVEQAADRVAARADLAPAQMEHARAE
jgi:glycerol dehydrogenase